jgi:hypothetical protein
MGQIVLRQMQVEDTGSIAQFLAGVFQTSTDTLFVNPKLIEWKYFTPRPDWSGSRSYALICDEKIISHFSFTPAKIRSKDREIESMSIFDWAADRQYRGSGLQLYERFKEEVGMPTAFHTGASEAALRVLPKFGYEIRGESITYAKRIRPWKLFLSDRKMNWKSPLRLIRDFARNTFARAVSLGAWTVQPVQQFDNSLAKILDRQSRLFSVCQRTISLLNYMLGCPVIPFSGYLLYEHGKIRGYFILSRLENGARIVDIFVDSEAQEDWRIAYSAPTETAAADPSVCSIYAASTNSFLSSALNRAGYKPYGRSPVGIYDPDRLFEDLFPLNIQFFEADYSYLSWNDD